MSRNREKNSQSLHWMGVVKWVLIAGMLSVLGLSYMLCKNQNLHLADETHRLERKLASIQRRNEQLTDDLNSMKSPLRLQRRLAQMNSTLVRLSDLGQMVVPMDMRVRARMAPMGTLPEGGYDYGAPTVASAAGASSSTPAPNSQ
jgi:hypothetical protein